MLSVVVPTYNRDASISRALDSLLAQERTPPYEVVVVDNDSQDETAAIIRGYEAGTNGRVRYVLEREQGSSAARNAGIDAARGEIIAFVDDDVVVQRMWLSNLARVFEQYPDAWCVGGRVLLDLPHTLPAWFNPAPGIMATYLSLQDYGEATIRMERPKGFISANLAVHRLALRHVGVFDTTLGRFGSRLFCGEDLDLVRRIHRAGGGVYYCGLATVVHLVPSLRITKTFLRRRAYWEGRTEGFVHRRRSADLTSRTVRASVVRAAKEGAKSIFLHATGRSRESMEHELAAWKHAGYVRETLLPSENPGRASPTKSPA